MEALWFCIVILMLAMYAILDGFDLGSGVIHLFVARSESERRTVLAATGRFWDGNEAWLLLAGGALYCAFPAVYSTRGFYPLAVAMFWLLILRGISTELRRRVHGASVRRIFDISFSVSSLLLVVVFGAAAGSVIRGVPPTGESRFLNGFPFLCGIFALTILSLQSAAWMAMKSTGELQARCRSLASRVWWAVLICYAGVTAAGFAIQPHLLENLQTYSWTPLFAVFALSGLIGARLCLSVRFDLGAFASAGCLIAGSLACVAAGQFPYLLNSGYQSLTIYNANTVHPQLNGAIWWLPALVMAVGYNVSMHFRNPRGRNTERTTSMAQHRPVMAAGYIDVRR